MTSSLRRVAVTAMLLVATSSLAADLPPGALVRQGTAVLTIDDIDAFAARIPPEQRGGYFDSAKRLETTLRQLLVERQIADDARANGLDKDAGVQRQILLSTESTLSAARIAKLRESIVIPDLGELAQERYQARRESFNVPAIVDVQHILISSTKHSDDEAQAIAGKVHAEAVADPDKFLTLVTQYSEDPSAKSNNGLMQGAGDDAKYVAEFATAARQLTTRGQVSPVVKTKFGYHVLILVKKEPGRVRTFAEVKDDLIKELGDDYVNKQVVNYMETMQNNEVKSNAELVNSLRSRYGTVDLSKDRDQPTAQLPEPTTGIKQ